MEYSNDNQLVKEALTDAEAFNKLYSLYVKDTYCYLMSRLNSRQDAEDLTSIVWETVVKKLHTYKPGLGHGFKAWLLRIAHNALIDFFRSHNKETTVDLEDVQIKSEDETQLEQLKKQEKLAEIKLLLTSLPKQESEIVSLHFFNDLSCKEIGDILDIKEQTVSAHLYRGLKTVSKRLHDIMFP